jgi:leucine dehydrogenase
MVEIKEHSVDGYEKVVEGIDKASGLHCFIAIHDTTLGPALGGTRIYPYSSTEEALTDVLRLAEGMTYKSAIAEIGLGGGKSVIIADPKKQKTPDLLRAFAEVVDSLEGRYICAEDMGTTTSDMAIIREVTQYVVALDVVGSSGNPAPFTAWGVYQGVKAAAQHCFHSDSLADRTIAIQGLGEVGHRLAEHLFWEGARLILSDVDEERLAHLAAHYGAEALPSTEILSVECDILAPCAIGGIINPQTIPHLRCKSIAGAANNQLASLEDGGALRSAGVLYTPDYVINAGGIINVSFELDIEGYKARKAKKKVDLIYDTLLAIFKHAQEQGVSTSRAADEIARQKVAQGIGQRQHAICFHA